MELKKSGWILKQQISEDPLLCWMGMMMATWLYGWEKNMSYGRSSHMNRKRWQCGNTNNPLAISQYGMCYKWWWEPFYPARAFQRPKQRDVRKSVIMARWLLRIHQRRSLSWLREKKMDLARVMLLRPSRNAHSGSFISQSNLGLARHWAKSVLLGCCKLCKQTRRLAKCFDWLLPFVNKNCRWLVSLQV